MLDGELLITDLALSAEHWAPIDRLFRAVAGVYKQRAVSVLLSGAGSDGSLGTGSIREEGGINIGQDPAQAARLAKEPVFAGWPLVVLHDDARVARSSPDFLWSTWTRFEPAADIYAAETNVVRHHLAYSGPIVIDARLKPGFPKELIASEDVARLVEKRWREYFPQDL